jgi:tetratricopeptide (TPR) repeat protein
LASRLGKRRLFLLLIGLAIVVGASLPPFMTASCLTRQQTPAEIRALENLRSMTRGGVLPADDVVARIESEFPRTKAAALARLVRARIKLNARDYAGAAVLLDAKVIGDQTNLADYALFTRAAALEQAGQIPQARAVYQELIHSYPSSLRAREATLRVAELLIKDNQAAAVPLLLKNLAAKDDAAALLLTARAAEQVSDPARALAAYRRLYFFAPAAEEGAQAANAFARLGSSTSPGSIEEAR